MKNKTIIILSIIILIIGILILFIPYGWIIDLLKGDFSSDGFIKESTYLHYKKIFIYYKIFLVVFPILILIFGIISSIILSRTRGTLR